MEPVSMTDLLWRVDTEALPRNGSERQRGQSCPARDHCLQQRTGQSTANLGRVTRKGMS
jgi:hypothetical protein